MIAVPGRRIQPPDFNIPMIAGAFYDGTTNGPFSRSLAQSAVAAIDTIYATPIYIQNTITTATFAIEVTAGAAGNARVGLYSHNNATGLPGTLITGSDVGNYDTTNIAVVSNAVVLTLTPGWYWTALVFSATPTMKTYLTTTAPRPIRFAANTTAGSVNAVAASASHTFAALPATMTSPAISSTAAHMIRVVIGT